MQAEAAVTEEKKNVKEEASKDTADVKNEETPKTDEKPVGRVKVSLAGLRSKTSNSLKAAAVPEEKKEPEAKADEAAKEVKEEATASHNDQAKKEAVEAKPVEEKQEEPKEEPKKSLFAQFLA